VGTQWNPARYIAGMALLGIKPYPIIWNKAHFSKWQQGINFILAFFKVEEEKNFLYPYSLLTSNLQKHYIY
jgi:hypothetical protein